MQTPGGIITGQQYGANIIPSAVANVGQDVTQAGDEMQHQQDALDLITADKNHRAALLGLRTDLTNDPDYRTIGTRFATGANDLTNQAAANISNPQARQQWIQRANYENAQQQLHIDTHASTLAKQDNAANLEDSLRVDQSYYAAAKTDDERRSILRGMNDKLYTASQYGIGGLYPNQIHALRDKYINGAMEMDGEQRIANGDAKGVLKDINEGGTAPPSTSDDLGIVPIVGQPVGAGKRNQPIQGIVIHHTAGSTLQGALEEGRRNGTGANYYVDRDGTIYRGAPENQYTAHIQPPTSGYRNGNNPNLSSQNTIGIETVAKNDADVTPEQRDAIQRLTTDVARRNGIRPENVVGHGDIQGGPGGNKEADEGVAAARAYRDSAAGQGLYPAGRYAMLKPDRLRALTYKAKTALSNESQQDIKRDIDGMRRGEDPQTDQDGKTSLDRSSDILQPNQFSKLSTQWDQAKTEKQATYGTPGASGADSRPLSDLSESDAIGRISGVRDGTVQKNVAKNWDQITKLRKDDPAQWADGQMLRGAGGPQPSFDQSGNLHIDQGDDHDMRIRTAPEVREVLDGTSVRHPDLSLGQTDGGQVTVDANADPSKRYAFWGSVFGARQAAQERVGIYGPNQRIVTKKEAQDLFGDRDLAHATDEEFGNALKDAQDKAIQLYGPNAQRVLHDSVKLIASAHQKSQLASDVAAGVLSGKIDPETFFPASPQSFAQSGWFGQSTPAPIGEYTEQAQGAVRGARAAMPTAETPPAPGTMPAIGATAADVAQAPASPNWQPTNMVPTIDIQPPSDGHMQWLLKNDSPSARQIFNAKFGRGAAQRYLEEYKNQPQR